MNRQQRQLRTISDSHCDDTAVEIELCERARIAFDLTRRALLDRQVMVGEAREILVAQRAIVALAEDSAGRNRMIQRDLDEYIRMLAPLPAASIARLPEAA